MAQDDAKEMLVEEESLIDPIYNKFVKSIVRAIGSTDFYEFFMDSISRADNEFQFSNRKLVKIVDLKWVDAVEEALTAFQNIVESPRNVIKEEELIVNVANAKKAGPETVRHLAQHANLVDEYHETSGDIRPGRLMQRYREDSIGLYENRLVFTTMEFAYRFVKIRHDALLEAMSDEFGAKLKVRSDMDSATEHVHMDTFIHIKEIDSTLDTDNKNEQVFATISKIYRILSAFMRSTFSQQMSQLPRVKGAINKTNILKRNKDYKKVLELLNFLKKYDQVGYTIKVVEQNPEINEKFERDIYHNILFNYLVLKGYLEDEADRKLPSPSKEKRKTLKPKFIKEIIEELTEDYDLPDVEVRKVLIEEMTKAQLMKEEAKERRRLVEEQEARRKAERERLKAEAAAERERIKQEKAAERERIRQEKEAEQERLQLERAERELEDRRRTALFREDISYFESNLFEQSCLREEAREKQAEGIKDFADAAGILEEEEQRKREEQSRERQRRREERERLQREAEQAKREELEKAERERLAKLEEEERERREAEERENAEYQALVERDREALEGVSTLITVFASELASRLEMRRRQAEAARRAEAEREEQRRRRHAQKVDIR
ncbi:MAG: DUF2357 domain-containing protein [Clostridia bacterium]|nr:DUF2357 domain-containing protein [Clostridia bacterium]